MDAGLNDGFIGGGLYMYVGFETGGATGEGTGCKEGSPVPADVVGSCVGAVVGSSIGGVVGSAIGGAVGSSIGGVVGSGRVVGSTILGAGVPDIVGVIVSPLIEHIYFCVCHDFTSPVTGCTAIETLCSWVFLEQSRATNWTSHALQTIYEISRCYIL